MARNEKEGKHSSETKEFHYDRIDLRSVDDLDDASFANFLRHVRSVNMLDVNEAQISNESIRLMSTLEFVKELRAKGCHQLDNGCIPYLNNIKGLQFLHLRYTGVNIDGLLQLNKLDELTTLMFSADDVTAIEEKLLQLKMMLPKCELVIDAKRYYFNAVKLFIKSIYNKPYSYRIKIKNEPSPGTWSNWLIQPSDSYLEAETQGPYPISDIEWLDIDPVVIKAEGTLMPVEETDHSEEILQLLNSLDFPYMETNGIISTYLVEKEI